MRSALTGVGSIRPVGVNATLVCHDGRVYFALLGFRFRESDDPPVWEPDDAYDDHESAIAAARQKVASLPDGRVEVFQFDGNRGRIVFVVTADEVVSVSPVHIAVSADEERVLAASRRATTSVGLMAVRRSWRTTSISSIETADKVARRLDDQLRGDIEWRVEKSGVADQRRFRYTRGEIIRGREMGAHASGEISAASAGSTVELRYRPSRAAAGLFGLAGSLSTLSLIAIIAKAGQQSGIPWAGLAAVALFGASACSPAWLVRKHRRQIDTELIAACAGHNRQSGLSTGAPNG